MKNIINVIIPVKNRYDKLYYTIKNILSDDYSHLNLIVSDNSSEKDIDFYRNFSDKRLRVLFPNNDLEMYENYQYALNELTEGWVGYIGSDDGVVPGSFSYLNFIINSFRDIDAVRFSSNYYIWPNNENEVGKIIFNNKNKILIRDSNKYLKKAINGFIDYDQLPIIYNGGFAKYDLIKKLSINNVFFKSRCPDVYSGIAICLNTKKYLFVDKPLFFYGSSHDSSGNSLHQTTGILKNNNAAYDFFNRGKWHNKCPININNVPIRSLYVYFIESLFWACDTYRINISSELHIKILNVALSYKNKDKNINKWAQLYCNFNEINISRVRCKNYFYKLILFINLLINRIYKNKIVKKDKNLNNVNSAMNFMKNEI